MVGSWQMTSSRVQEGRGDQRCPCVTARGSRVGGRRESKHIRLLCRNVPYRRAEIMEPWLDGVWSEGQVFRDRQFYYSMSVC